ncbi:hypothetical protein SAMD00020551_0728 [Mesobacillus selenatarsenatis SF-1]|uniref:Uncharacterized protein n=1 Tax=Mesobacillus selenatarsenatis (strain DSM 18680 / JCM 14380 / FERM P-15431 / SF-1) TaxID=1321606 RepID=A0A0A8WY49_MESS1|nr:hypothetical protein SAMD00020551_0728 [Mesobacillus selenatarsenatis SF-1]
MVLFLRPNMANILLQVFITILYVIAAQLVIRLEGTSVFV